MPLQIILSVSIVDFIDVFSEKLYRPFIWLSTHLKKKYAETSAFTEALFKVSTTITLLWFKAFRLIVSIRQKYRASTIPKFYFHNI